MDDNAIIELYFARDERALRETSDKYGALCLSVANNILGCHEDAEETVNDAYLAAWNSIPPARPNSLRAFVCSIARNAALKRFEYNTAKKRSPSALLSFSELEEILTDGADIPDTSDISAEELGGLIESFLKTQSADARCVFVRRYWFFDPIADIAKKYSFSESKVKTLLSRTRGKLKKYLNKEGWFV